MFFASGQNKKPRKIEVLRGFAFACLGVLRREGLLRDPHGVIHTKESKSLHRCTLVAFFISKRLQTEFEPFKNEKSPGKAEGFTFYCGERDYFMIPFREMLKS